jgi:RNA polymerase sigma-70 factor (ECF subfamily)
VHHDNEFEIEKPNMNGSLTDCIKRLNKEQQQCIQLFYFNSKSYVEIAEQIGLNQNKVRSYIQNGRRNLKICMEKKHGKTASHRR